MSIKKKVLLEYILELEDVCETLTSEIEDIKKELRKQKKEKNIKK